MPPIMHPRHLTRLTLVPALWGLRTQLHFQSPSPGGIRLYFPLTANQCPKSHPLPLHIPQIQLLFSGLPRPPASSYQFLSYPAALLRPFPSPPGPSQIWPLILCTPSEQKEPLFISGTHRCLTPSSPGSHSLLLRQLSSQVWDEHPCAPPAMTILCGQGHQEICLLRQTKSAMGHSPTCLSQLCVPVGQHRGEA